MLPITLADSHLTLGALSKRVSATNLRHSGEAISGLALVANSIASMHVPFSESLDTLASLIRSTTLNFPPRSNLLIVSTLNLALTCLSVNTAGKSMLIGRFTITFLMRKIAFSTALDPFSLGLFRRGLPCLYLFSDAPSDVQPLASATRERRPHNG